MQLPAADNTPPDHRLRLPELLAYRRAAERRRAIAFTDLPMQIMGVSVRPLTPATWTILQALPSPFTCGGRAEPTDVLDFLWIHSAGYCHTGVADWQRRKRSALAPAVLELRQPWRRCLGLAYDLQRQQGIFAIAISEIERTIEDAFADAPARSARPAAPVASLEAFLTHEFAAAYHWPAEYTRHQPLVRLIQLHRLIRVARGETITDEGEDRILAAHLAKKNAPRLLRDAQTKAAMMAPPLHG